MPISDSYHDASSEFTCIDGGGRLAIRQDAYTVYSTGYVIIAEVPVAVVRTTPLKELI